MATDVSHTGAGTGMPSADIVGGAVIAVLGIVHLFAVQLGGFIGYAALLVGWPLIGGTVAARLAVPGNERVVGVLAGAFGALATGIVILFTGYLGMWSGFITSGFGVTLWPVTFGMLLMFLVAWSVFGLVGAEISVRYAA